MREVLGTTRSKVHGQESRDAEDKRWKRRCGFGDNSEGVDGLLERLGGDTQRAQDIKLHPTAQLK